ncbi:helix-turn-helix domain-containing protein [Labrys sp. KNU-23]|uniref:helix-turn-helix domain-containing protein n=1 Tax=Labrys sp. KNU-23 TaxID=2789216 RepID=UPI0011EDAFCE|nr:helix-turn-helix domain-containing protein [Labrys sp. KNU-23]QEN88586.1 helix-turn-helix domain-containing protein [Labrys sp. KNU-23]
MIAKERAPAPQALLHRINDVVRMTNVGRTTIYGEIASGRLRIVKLGRATLVRDEDLHAWLDGMSVNASRAA